MKKMRLDDEKIFWAVTGLYFMVFMTVDIVVALMERRLNISYMPYAAGAGVVLFGLVWGAMKVEAINKRLNFNMFVFYMFLCMVGAIGSLTGTGEIMSTLLTEFFIAGLVASICGFIYVTLGKSVLFPKDNLDEKECLN
ncbi:hypothetical protein N6147_001740 [Proteus mirabilis]|nr:hypothetical protein [Proteus mirabilis]